MYIYVRDNFKRLIFYGCPISSGGFMLKKLIFIFCGLAVNLCLFAQGKEPKNLDVFRKAYPDVTFESVYDQSVGDYKITVTVEKRTGVFYWQDGKLLPRDELKNSKLYSPLLYQYPDTIPDPQKFSQDDIKRIKNFSNPDNRQKSYGTPTYFFDLIYDCKNRGSLEKRLTRISFLGKKSTVHDRIVSPLKKVESRILSLSKSNKEVQDFLNKLESTDSYSWREISDSKKRSFHSLAVAIDVLPVNWRNKNIYWAWRRDIDPNWMLLSLDKRWTPPLEVIKIFEEEGFIYGGKWAVWDNMHFEYHPELLIYGKL